MTRKQFAIDLLSVLGAACIIAGLILIPAEYIGHLCLKEPMHTWPWAVLSGGFLLCLAARHINLRA
jgi:hypothetical protein